MTYKAIYHYSNSGNTKAIVENADAEGFDVYNLKHVGLEDLNFAPYDVILLGTPTYGKGVPPRYFKEIQESLASIEGKKIGLFGSGNSIYENYCGGLDLLEDFLSKKNKVLFKYKFESYPTALAQNEFQNILDRVR